MNSKQLCEKRYAANCALVDMLKAIVSDDNGNQRLGQILRNYGFVIHDWHDNSLWANEFNLEPNELLIRVIAETAKVLG
jgi:hypothetical protein